MVNTLLPMISLPLRAEIVGETVKTIVALSFPIALEVMVIQEDSLRTAHGHEPPEVMIEKLPVPPSDENV
jgi:hypothetical protein